MPAMQIKQRRRERKEAIVTAHEAHIEKLRRDTAKAYAEHEEAVYVKHRLSMLGPIRIWLTSNQACHRAVKGAASAGVGPQEK